MSSPAVHLRSPIKSSAAFQSTDSVPDSTPHSPLHHHTPFNQFNADSLNPFSSATVDGGGSFSRVRSRPRLAKLRKQSASQHARSRTRTAVAAGDAASGFDSVRSDQVSDNIRTLNGFARGSGEMESGAGACNGGSSNCRSKFRNEGFVFGAGRAGSDSARVSDSEQGANARYREGSGSSVDGGEGAIERETEIRKSGRVEFVFNARQSDAESNLGRKTGDHAAGMGCGDGRKMGLDSELKDGLFDVKGFVFRADQNGSVDNSNAEKGKSSECVKNLGLNGDRERKGRVGVECERQDNFHFVFGDNHSGKKSSFNEEKQEALDRMRGSARGNDDKSKSGYGSTNGVSAADSAIPTYKLTDEMNKLNINHSEGADTTRDSVNLHVSSSGGFVFGESEKACSYSSAGSGTNAGGHENAPSENIGRQYFKACETNNVQNGAGCGISCGSTGIPGPTPSISQEGIQDFQCGRIPEYNVPGDSQLNGATASFSSSSVDLDSEPYSAGHSLNADHDKRDNYFASIPEASKEFYMDFKPPTWDPSSFKDNLFPKLNKSFESTQKVRSSKEKGSKYLRRKLKPHSLNKKQTRLDHLSKESSSLGTPDSSGCGSPMDFSPYQETTTDDHDVKASEELNDMHSAIPADSKDEHSAAVGSGVNTSTTDQRYGNLDNDKLFSQNGSFPADFHSSGPEIVWPNLKTEQYSSSSIADSGFVFSSNSERQNAGPFCFVHGLGDSKEKDFAFSTPSTVTSSALKRKQKKKFRRKVDRDSFVISPNLNGKFESSVQFLPLATAKEGDFASSATIHETCEKWRLRGNQAYKGGDLSKAEDFYTLGINSVPSNEKSGCWIKPLLLCYSNRAATRMRVGRIREALLDCMISTDLDPSFLKVQMRTANCHLLLGELENAQQCFSKCMESVNAICLDRRVVVEAAEGLQKAQKVAECLNNAAELLNERTSDAAGTALELLTKALSISLYSEKLLQMKAEALILMQKYDAAIQLCDQSRYLAEKNFDMANSTNNFKISMCDSFSFVNLWRWSLISKCYFHLGRLEASLNVLDKLQQVVSVNDKHVIDNIEDLLSLAATVRELLDHKRAGNENFKLGKYTEAVENYTVALSSNIKSRPFAAICFCNRAAAHQALGQIADAIADCSMAMALDGNYVKAISRRATLHEMVRDYEQATCDLRRVISALETQSNQKAKQSDSPNESHGVKELRQAQQRLLTVEDQTKKEIPLDFYLILGVKPADTATDIKKAYHKAALRHHPDKAGQLLARSEVGGEGRVSKEILQEVHKDADRLFKMIGEAYAVLSDPTKRSEYDLEEELRKAAKQSNRGGTCRRSSDVYGYGRPSDGYKSSSDGSYGRRYGRDRWKTYGYSYSRW